MNFSKDKLKDFQFLEVDEDLRRIAEREASKPLCPFGKNCYRKNPNHLQEYRHQSSSGSVNKTNTNGKNAVKRGKITDFFSQKPTPLKKLHIEVTKRDKTQNDCEIEDSEEEEVTTSKKVDTKDQTNSISREPTFKRQIMSPNNIKNNTKTEKRKRTKNGSDSHSDNGFESIINILNEGKCLSETTPKRLNTKSKKNTYSPNVRKLAIIEDITPNKTIKSNESLEEVKVEQQTDINNSELNGKNTSFSPQINSKMTSNQWNQLIKEIFLFEMPKDFFYLWEFCKSIKRQNPEDALIDTLGLRLVGPYDILNGKLDKTHIESHKEQILCHFRYFYDLPELQTTVVSNKSAFHLGYFRDTPEEDNPVVVSNNSDKSCIIEGVADNICAAIYSEIQKQKSREASNTGLKQIESKLKAFCDINKIDLKANSKLKSRKTKISAKTFNNFGFIVPYDKKTEVGYRPLPITDSQLHKLFDSILKVDADSRNECKSLTELQDIIRLINYANDECDFGMGLELGIDLFCSGHPFFHKSALHLLCLAYDLLKREAFSRIIKAHLQYRRKGYTLSAI